MATSSRPGRPRLKDVAAAAGVDVSVVSRVLRDVPNRSVRPETRQRILDAAERLSYRPHPGASSLKTARTGAIGLLVPDLANPAAVAIVRGAEERALSVGYVLLVATGSVADRVPALDGRVDGLLVGNAIAGHRAGLLASERYMPMLLVNRRESGPLSSIVVDDEAGARLAVRHLVSLGHRRIGHVAGPLVSDTGRRRLRGFRVQMSQEGLEVPPQWVAEGPYDEGGGYAAARHVLATNPRPTAIFVSNLLATIGTMSAARRLGLALPSDLSVVSFDDLALAAYLDPPVTTVRLPLKELGRQAVDSLLRMIEGGGDVQDAVIDRPPELVLRSSVVPALPDDAG
jgi:LacI family transcriptional regulator